MLLAAGRAKRGGSHPRDSQQSAGSSGEGLRPITASFMAYCLFFHELPLYQPPIIANLTGVLPIIQAEQPYSTLP